MTPNNETTIKLNAVPEPGQLVEARRRRWVVADVASSVLSGGKIDGTTQTLVSLESLDEDALGEELQIVWELEPGAQVLENVGLPPVEGCDSNDELEAFLDAVRWGAVTNADRKQLQAPFRSGIEIEDYQLEPLVRALDMSRVNLLIADDVGLGKTIEAGLVVQELLLRHRARTVFIVCPASLQLKWKTEMLEKFGLEFCIVDAEYLKTLRRKRGLRVNPWLSHPRLIASMDWIKTGEGLRLLKEVLPAQRTYPRKFDVLIVDEAHNIAPSGSGDSTPSLRTKVIQRMAPHFTHRLFLSATPHNGYQSSFTSLLELLDDQRFSRYVEPSRERLQQVMTRRLKDAILDSEGNPVFAKRKLNALEVDYADEERKISETLRRFTSSRLASVQGSRARVTTEFVNVLLKKRFFSSPLAFAQTLAKHREALLNPKPKEVKKYEESYLRKATRALEEDVDDENVAEERTNDLLGLDAEIAPELTEEQRKDLDLLYEVSQKNSNKADSKARAILDWLENHIRRNGKWSKERVVIFTEYRATLSWLKTILAHEGYGGDRLATIDGGTPTDDREAIKAAFQTSPDARTKAAEVRILLATDAASEGIDLQNYCRYLIHVEIPWNPNVMEQRNGRIDRHGQKSKIVEIWHPVGKGFDQNASWDKKPGDLEGDYEYLMRAAMKVDAIRNDLGSAGSVIVEQIQNAMLGRSRDALNVDTKETQEKRRRAAQYVKADKEIKSKIVSLHEKLTTSKKEFKLSPERIARVVNVALGLAGLPPLKPCAVPMENVGGGVWRAVPPGAAFDVPMLPGSWGRACAGLEHPCTHKRRPLVFDDALVKGREDLALGHLNHKLVQMALRLLREEIWNADYVRRGANDGKKRALNRIAFKTSPNVSAPVALVLSRLVVTGGDCRRLHEETIMSGVELRENSSKRIDTLGDLRSYYEDSEPLDNPPERIVAIARNLYEKNADALKKSVLARSKERVDSLFKTLEEKKKKEIQSVLTLLEELEASILRELTPEADAKQEVFDFIKESERREDLRVDSEKLRKRLERIPEEKEKETEAIERGYSNPTPRTFPVAVLFVMPQSARQNRFS